METKEYAAIIRELLEEIKSDLRIHLQEAVKESVTETVNGKIDKIQNQMNGQDLVLKNIQRDIGQLKTDTDPLVDGKKTITNVGKFILWICGLILAVAAVLRLIK